jgi:hypothetical protein
MTGYEPPNVTAALRYANLDYPVIPIKRHSKVVDLPNGFKGATRDPRKIREMFRSYHGVGIAPTADVLVIDIDVSKDTVTPIHRRIAETRDRYVNMCRRFPEMAIAPTHRTPSGGFHVFLQLPQGVPKLTACAWPRGAEETYGELRGLGRSYVLVPW